MKKIFGILLIIFVVAMSLYSCNGNYENGGNNSGNEGTGDTNQGESNGESGTGEGNGDANQGESGGEGGAGEENGDLNQGESNGESGAGEENGDLNQGESNGESGAGEGNGDANQGENSGEGGAGEGNSDLNQGESNGESGAGEGNGDANQGESNGESGAGEGNGDANQGENSGEGDSNDENGGSVEEIPYGNEVGYRCYGMDLAIIDEFGETGEYINPNSTGKITILNFWGVWCPYCLYEMPDLDKIASDFSDKVTVVAVHSSSRQGEAPDYIANGYEDSEIIFVNDTMVDDYYNMVTGSIYYPYTVILDENGVIISKHVGATNYNGFYNMIKDYLD